MENPLNLIVMKIMMTISLVLKLQNMGIWAER